MYDDNRYYAGQNDFRSYTIWPYSPSGALVGDFITTANSLAPETLDERLNAALKEGVANA